MWFLLLMYAACGLTGAGANTLLFCGCHVLEPGLYEITSPGWPGEYPSNSDCNYTLVSFGLPMTMSCASFSLEYHSSCVWDWLKVDGVKYCGNSGPTNVPSSALNIEFHSDYIINDDGYRCTIEVSSEIPCGTFSLPQGDYFIQSPNYPDPYVNDYVCEWKLSTADPTDLIEFSCSNFSVESHPSCGFDWLEVEGVKYCNGQPPPPAIDATGTLNVTFVTDYSVVLSGFWCSVHVTSGDQGVGTTPLSCDDHQLEPGLYEITSPGWPGQYPSYSDCNYSLHGPGLPMKLTCTSFSLESHSSCAWDWLQVNGTKYCGTNGPTNVLGGLFDIDFHSDYVVNDDGYRCTIEVPSEIPCGTFSLAPGDYFIQSPNYPNQYVNSYACAWELSTAQVGDIIRFNCSDFSVESHPSCGYDWLEVEGVKYCDGQPPPAVRTINTLNISFVTDFSVVRTGFRCSVEVTSNTCCGVSDSSSRIIGGSNAGRHELPWQAGVVDAGGSSVWCGGTLITDRDVLTAAHCVHDKVPPQLEVLLREHDTSTADGELRVAVSDISPFPSFTHPWEGDDFALLQLAQPVQFGVGLRPACLPPAGHLFTGEQAVISGWGLTSHPNGSPSAVLQKATVQVVSHADCADAYANFTTIDNTMMCADGGGASDACQGDSGGPLTVQLDGRWVVAGVTSFATECGSAQYPGVFARVTAALDFIRALTHGSVYCSAPTACGSAGSGCC